MKKVLKIFLLQVCIIMYSHSFAQTNFSTGFDAGFKEGFCYNKSIGCLPPLTPMTPLTKIGESDNSYQDGYNRGFQVGLDLQRLQGGSSTSTYSNPNNYTGLPKYTPSEYVPPVDLKLLASVLERKQRLFDSRLDWLRKRLSGIRDFNYCILSEIAPTEKNSIDNYINKYFGVMNVDLTNDNIFNQIVSTLNGIEKQIYTSYSNAILGINLINIPENFSKTYTNGSCSIKASNSNIVSYSITDNTGKNLTSGFYEAFNLLAETFNDDPPFKLYYVYSKTDNNYYKIGEDKVEDASQNNTIGKMKFVFSSEVLFMLKNFKGSFWIFDKGISKAGSINDLGDKVFKTSSGKVEVYRVYQDKYSSKKYYIPKEIFDNGTVNQEYPIYSN